MRRELLDVICCPCCGGSDLVLYEEDYNDIEVRCGYVVCRECKARLDVKDGILNSLLSPDKIVEGQQAAMAKLLVEERSKKTDQWLLSLPVGFEENYDILANFRELISRLDLSGKEKVLDIGAGNCWSTSWFATLGCYCVATDIVEDKYIGLSSSDTFIGHNGAYFERVICDMTELPFQNESFDVIFATASLHHSPHIEQTFGEIGRVLKAGGRLALIHEPVCNIFRKPKKFGEKEITRYGINESIYNILEYLRFAWRADLKPRVYFAPSTGEKLKERRLFSGLWKNKISRATTRHILFYPVILLRGTQFIMIAKKD